MYMTMDMPMDEFEDRLDQGLITDFEPYLKRNAKTEVRRRLAERGLCVEQLAKMEEVSVVCTLIHKGYAQEYYERWSKHTSPDIRHALARAGYFPEKFLRDRSKLVRAAVLKKHPEYAFQLLSYTNFEFRAAEGVIRRMPNLTREQLETFLKAVDGEDTNEMTEYYQLKLAGVTKEPSILETTMSAKDLHKLGNVLWMRALSVHQIKLYDEVMRHLISPDKIDAFYAAFDDLASADVLWECHQIIDRHTLKTHRQGNQHRKNR